MTSLFPPLSNDARRTLNRLHGLIDKVFPLPGRFRSGLPRDVAELSRLLTADRQDRSASYLGKPALLSAYLRYFMPWNIYRLCRLLPNLPLDLKSHDTVNDLGAGPLTLAISLWITRPDLRSMALEFRCVDRTPAILEAGKKFFAALAAETTEDDGSGCPWVIKTIRGELKRHGGLSVEIKGKPAALTTAINVYNELFWNFSPLDTEGLAAFADRSARLLSSLTESSGAVLVMEPGIPRSGEFISLLRSGLMRQNRSPLSPCAHSFPCPLPGSPRKPGASRRGSGTNTSSAKWCHFAFDTEDAPEELHKLSEASGIPKERAVLSFIFTGSGSPSKAVPKGPVKIRIISDSFPVAEHEKAPAKISRGRYGCSEQGVVLVTGSRESLARSPSGTLEELCLKSGARDPKSGAQVAVKP